MRGESGECAGALGSVLLVEPARELREALGDELAALGFRVLEARDAPEAFAALKRAAVDLIVSELRGLSLDGVALLERLGRDGPPAVMMSRSGDVSTAVRSMRAGALDFVSLPTDLGELARRIAGLVGVAVGERRRRPASREIIR